MRRKLLKSNGWAMKNTDGADKRHEVFDDSTSPPGIFELFMPFPGSFTTCFLTHRRVHIRLSGNMIIEDDDAFRRLSIIPLDLRSIWLFPQRIHCHKLLACPKSHFVSILLASCRAIFGRIQLEQLLSERYDRSLRRTSRPKANKVPYLNKCL